MNILERSLVPPVAQATLLDYIHTKEDCTTKKPNTLYEKHKMREATSHTVHRENPKK